jgi:anti-sigma-K factor RskA
MTEPRPTCTGTEQAVGWALHALEPDEEIAVERHVPTCADCLAAVRDTEAVMAQLATAAEPVDPPPRLRAAILDAAAAIPQVRPQRTVRPSPTARRSRAPRPTGLAGSGPGGFRPTSSTPPGPSRRLIVGRFVAAAVAAVALVAIGSLGLRTVQLQQQLATASSQVSSTTELVRSLSRPGSSHALLAGPDGTTVAAVVLTDGQRTVYTIGLAANSADQTYVLWGMKDSSAAPQPLGVFDVDERNAGPQTVGSPDQQPFRAYAISLEPGRTPPSAPTDVVASGSLAA